MEPSETPKASVVIATTNALHHIDACLSSLVREAEVAGLEIIVADASLDGTADHVRATFPSVRVLDAPSDCELAHLKYRGIAASRGPIVAILEPHCCVPEDWGAILLRAHEAPHLAIGGLMEGGAYRGAVGWAAYFCEYGQFMPPMASGIYPETIGNNISYKREAFDGFRESLERDGFWKIFLHWHLESRGEAPWTQGDWIAIHNRDFGFIEFLVQRFHFGRFFASERTAHMHWSRRVLYSCGAPLIPPLFALRLLTRVWPKRRRRGLLLKTLPFNLAFYCAWALGEAVGNLAGAGSSAAHVRY